MLTALTISQPLLEDWTHMNSYNHRHSSMNWPYYYPFLTDGEIEEDINKLPRVLQVETGLQQNQDSNPGSLSPLSVLLSSVLEKCLTKCQARVVDAQRMPSSFLLLLSSLRCYVGTCI